MEFRKYFSEEVLQEGYQCYKDHKVKYFTFQHSTFSSIVRGYHNYDVNIDVEGTVVKEMSCTCTNAEEVFCKHIVATFYKINDYLDYKLVLEDDLKEKSKEELIQYILQEAWK